MKYLKPNPAPFSFSLLPSKAWLFWTIICLTTISCIGSSQKLKKQESQVKGAEAASWGPYQSAGLNRPIIKNQRILQAMSRVPRHEFVPEEMSPRAYEDRALPIGNGQTISQPFIVALMTQAAEVDRGSRVLEIGTGSGYQSAVLAELGAEVFSIEIVPKLAEEARQRLQKLGYKTVTVLEGDGWRGLPEHAPFDAVLVTAAAPQPPVKLIEQLANRGKLIVPIEDKKNGEEILVLIEKNGTDLITKNLGEVRFVPLTGIGRVEESSPGVVNSLAVQGKKKETPLTPIDEKQQFQTPLVRPFK